MKKILLTLSFLVIALFIISCSEESDTVPETSDDLVVVMPDIEQPEEPEPVIPDEVKELIIKKDKVKSYSYNFGVLNQGNTYHILGDKVKIELFEKPSTSKEDQYDTVFLDNTKKTAFGSCENPSCDVSLRSKYRELDYNQYKLTSTPFDIFDDIKTVELSDRGKLINDRDTVMVKIADYGDNQIEAFLDNFYAFPHEIKITDPDGEETLLQYHNVQINSLKEGDVILPTKYNLLGE